MLLKILFLLYTHNTLIKLQSVKSSPFSFVCKRGKGGGNVPGKLVIEIVTAVKIMCMCYSYSRGTLK